MNWQETGTWPAWKRRRGGTHSLPIWLTKDQFDQLTRAAELMGCTRSELIRTFVRLEALQKYGSHG